MTPLDDYRDAVLASVCPVPAEQVAVAETLGRVLAEDATAQTPLPPFRNAAMDGYAVRAADLCHAPHPGPMTLQVIGAVAAGAADSPGPRPGEAVRIMTGAPVPAGADSVIPVEATSSSGDAVTIHQPPTVGQHIRLAGEDVEEGQIVVTAGSVVGPAMLGLLAAVGRASVRCHRRVRVSVIATGDELVPPGHVLRPHQIYNSNGPMLVALAQREGAIAGPAAIVPDDPDQLRRQVRHAAEGADLVVVSGGVSAGDHDYLPDVLAELGPCERAQLAMSPGKPQARGKIGDVTVLGLPGNPVSSFVSFELIALQAIHRLQGRTTLGRRAIVATAGEDLRGSPGRRTFLRVRLERTADANVAFDSGGRGSHLLSALAAADGLAEVEEDHGHVAAGESITVHLLGTA